VSTQGSFASKVDEPTQTARGSAIVVCAFCCHTGTELAKVANNAAATEKDFIVIAN
jgi:hypothetical protein